MKEGQLPLVIVVMGVCGSGKTTLAQALAARLHWEFADADNFHAAANIEKMSRGIALQDEDRRLWLQAIAAWIDDHRRGGIHGVVTCSALKRHYRDVLIGDRQDVRLVYLKGTTDVIASRMAARKGHFMPRALLRSQLESLEEPAPDENAMIVSIEASPKDIVDEILNTLNV